MDRHGTVLYVGTFSKVVFPGLRVGWIAAPKTAIEVLTSIQHASCLAASTLAQAGAERFCRGGDFEAYLRRIHRIYRRRMQVMQEALTQQLPTTVQWTRPVGGYTLWLTLPGTVEDESDWCERLARAGVRTAPGSRFYGRKPSRGHLRLSIACVDEEQIREGCRRMGEVLAETGELERNAWSKARRGREWLSPEPRRAG
jgi:DNA-binding transcriptional MocR family regulator